MHVLHKYSNTSPQMAEMPMYKGFRAKETSRHTSRLTSRLTSRPKTPFYKGISEENGRSGG